jgi:hypothetical protein
MGMKYLTNREAAQARLDGKKLLFHGKEYGDGTRVDLSKLDESTDCYTIAPETITRTITYPAPYRGPMEMGQMYYLAHPILAPPRSRQIWNNDAHDTVWLALGLVHLTEADAIAHAKALIGGEG